MHISGSQHFRLFWYARGVCFWGRYGKGQHSYKNKVWAFRRTLYSLDECCISPYRTVWSSLTNTVCPLHEKIYFNWTFTAFVHYVTMVTYNALFNNVCGHMYTHYWIQRPITMCVNTRTHINIYEAHILYKKVFLINIRDAHPMLVKCWDSVVDDVPTLHQHWVNIMCCVITSFIIRPPGL